MDRFTLLVDRSTDLYIHPLAWRLRRLLTVGLLPLLLSPSISLADPGAALIPPRPVQVAEVREIASTERLRLPGALRAVRRVEMSFLHAGQMTSRAVQRGQHVTEGELLASLYHPSLHPALNAAEAQLGELDEQLAQLARELARLEDLHRSDLVATEQWERLQSQQKRLQQARLQALAAHREARSQLDETQLRAPYPATVVSVHAQPGQFISPGQPVVSLADLSTMELELAMPVRYTDGLHVGDVVTVRALDSARTTQARIREIGLAEPGRAAAVIIELDQQDNGQSRPEWQPGMAVHAELHWLNPPRLQVPLAALVDVGLDELRLFRLRGDRVEALVVKSGSLHKGWLNVDGPLQAGDKVITAGHGRLLDGERVRVLP